MKARLEYKAQDIWIGVFWKNTAFINGSYGGSYKRVDVWVCIVPCFPLHLRWERAL